MSSFIQQRKPFWILNQVIKSIGILKGWQNYALILVNQAI